MSSAQLQSSGKTYVFPETDDAYDFLFKIVLIGDAGIGKTCIVQRFKHGFYMERHGNTIGVDFMLKTVEVEHKRVKLQIWDTAGQERFRTITQSYYRGANGVIVAYDISNADTFNHVPQWLDDVKRYAGSEAIMLLIGTKLDLVDSRPGTRQVTTEEAKSFASSKHLIDALETSAKENTNVERTFLRIARALVKKHEGVSSYMDPEDSISLTTKSLAHDNQCWC